VSLILKARTMTPWGTRHPCDQEVVLTELIGPSRLPDRKVYNLIVITAFFQPVRPIPAPILQKMQARETLPLDQRGIIPCRVASTTD